MTREHDCDTSISTATAACSEYRRLHGTISRRGFLGSSLRTAGLVVASTPFVPGLLLRASRAAEAHASDVDRILVVVQLAGGNDGLNTIVPHGLDAYYRARPSLALGPQQVLRIDDMIGYHPSLAAIRSLHDRGWVSVVQGVGYPQPDRSHFRSSEIWETARPEDARCRTGWLGRARAQLPPPVNEAIQLGSRQQSLALLADGLSATALDGLSSLEVPDPTVDPVRDGLEATFARSADAAPSSSSSLLGYLRRTGRQALAAEQRLARALQERDAPGGGVEYPAFGLAERLRDVAAVIRSGYPARIYFVSMSGFDTHARQLQQHALLLQELSQSVAAFLEDLSSTLGERAQRVLVLAYSEFGRRVAENKSAGTDHGAAAPVLLLSPGGLRGGLIGAHPALSSDALDDGDLRFHTDFRRVYATALGPWLGLDPVAVIGRHDPLPDILAT